MNEVRIMLMVANMFDNADELMKFVEKAVKCDKTTIPDTMLDARSKYHEFLKLPFQKSFTTNPDYISQMFYIYKLVLDIPKLGEMFESQKHRRFLMHLIAQHFVISECNSLRIRSGIIFNGVSKIMCSHTGLLKKYLQHSCAPNVHWMDRDGHAVLTTIRPIKKGDAILFSSINYMLLSLPKEDRQAKILELLFFVCKCARCCGPIASTVQRKNLVADPDYKYIKSKDVNFKKGDTSTWIEKFAIVSRKFADIPYDDLETVISKYVFYIQDRLEGPTDLFGSILAAVEDECEN